jgi:ribosomal-protein-serine acetyltransferase
MKEPPTRLPAVFPVARDIAVRRFEHSDVRQLHEAVSESVPEITAWMIWCRSGYSPEDAAAFISNGISSWETKQRYDLAIHHGATSTVLGSIGLSHLNWQHRCANVGYWVRSQWTNRGVARSAIGLAARFGFEQLGLTRLEFLIQPENIASLHAAKRAGAQEEGVLRRRLYLHGRHHDAVVLSLVAADLSPDGQ